MNIKKILLSLTLALSFAISGLVSSPALALGGSPLSGLITLKNLAKNATPYEEAIANSKPTLLEFYADWCSTCQSMAGNIEKLEAKYGDRLNLVMLDIDDPQWDDLGQDYQVTGIPQYNLLDETGNKIDSFVGKVPLGIMGQALNELING